MLFQEGETFHVVCHDCAFESLTASEEEAHQRSLDHAAETSHATRYARIQ